MRIAVMGAGGIGAYVGARLAAVGEDVAFIARGTHLAAMRRDGLTVLSPFGDSLLADVVATDRPADIGEVDLVLFTVKLWDTDTAAAALKPLIGSHTRVITLQNGIDSAAMIARHVPRDRIVAGVIYIVVVIERPGVVKSPGGLKSIVVDRAGGDPVVATFCDACNRGVGIDAEATDNADVAIWRKFVRLSSFSGATSLMRAPVGRIVANPQSRALFRQLIEEAVAVGRAHGTDLGGEFAEASMTFFDGLPPSARASMFEDLERGKPLELPWLSGRVHALGEELGVPTPGHSTVYRALAMYVEGNSASA
jgi:2-dehydropantoate 2-reductase